MPTATPTTSTQVVPSTLTHTVNLPLAPPQSPPSMSQEPTTGHQLSSPHSSQASLQDFPPLPMSKMLGKRGEASSIKSTGRSLRSLLPNLSLRKKPKSQASSTSLPLDPPSPLSPVPSSPLENPESLSSSVQTVRKATDPTPPPAPKSMMCSVMASGKRLAGGNDLQLTLNLSQLYTITN
ncbi:hypothetical protein EV421DRAFT_1908170 [Armillaria borealis]|uniref:Uncharacterized protein n=1 Tax=Armillaria borealis TaxID=47425 RepID=A0AA39J609_9AGAR|nr:hypothetical protein EV421DRAFT_1908170 [Armillaria borealis]